MTLSWHCMIDVFAVLYTTREPTVLSLLTVMRNSSCGGTKEESVLMLITDTGHGLRFAEIVTVDNLTAEIVIILLCTVSCTTM